MKTQIKNYDNYYIYDNGDVYNIATNKLLKGSVGEHGYKYYRLSKNGTKKMMYAHRLVAEHFLDNPNQLPVVNHIDGNKLNNNVNNLEWVTYSENTKKWHEKREVQPTRTNQKYTGDLENEIWLNIPDYENYLISSYGRVWNTNTNNILRPSLTCGYHKVRLSKNNQIKDKMIHHLVYSIFYNDIDFEGYVIDHIDGDKTNNHKDNLRKITASENVLSALYVTKTNGSAKKVGQYTKDGQFIASYPSAREAARVLGLDSSVISKVCRGVKYNSHGGFIFKYLED